jgi:hypothetical protein
MDEDLELSDSSSSSSSYAPEPEPEPDRFTQVVARELDVEIGMRTRLLDVLHSRIAWAEQLQAALKAEKTDGTRAFLLPRPSRCAEMPKRPVRHAARFQGRCPRSTSRS